VAAGRAGDRSVEKALRQLLASDNTARRMRAAEALCALGDAQARAVLERGRTSSDAVERQYGEWLLSRLDAAVSVGSVPAS
jgi:hypothetical protein